MHYSPVFIKIRAIALSSISVLDLLWIVVLCIVSFFQWAVLEVSERSLILVMLVTHSATAITLLILLIIHFRPWLDAARMMFLLIAQFGDYGNTLSGFFLICLNRVTYQEGVCTFVIAFILIGSWITPFLLVIYVFGLALMVWRHQAMTLKSLNVVDQENVLEPQEAKADLIPQTPLHVALAYRGSDSDRDSDSFENSRYSHLTKVSSTVEFHERVPVNMARLSKPPPVFRF
ncbi:hypothetical protein C0995_002734 [Termitomyces sp. Mi166|nr:hypothetical protein C0995_002734 [Termitomyces sp. Mi166\